MSTHPVTGSPPAHPAEPGRSDLPRQRAYDAARRHSARVRLLKFAIPAGALGAVGLVTLATVYNPFGRLPGLSMGPISLSGTKIAMENPRLTGYRKDSRPYEVTAKTAFQDVRTPGIIELKDLQAKLRLDTAGTIAELVSNGGVFDTTKEQLELSRDIRITTSRGEEVLLRSASVDMKAGTAVSREPVKITSRSGQIEAEGVTIADNGATISFTGRVRTQFERMVPGDAGGPAPASRGGPAPTGTPASRVSQAEPAR